MRLGAARGGVDKQYLCDVCTPSQAGMAFLRWLPLAFAVLVFFGLILVVVLLEAGVISWPGR
jgi:hypothetical protein